MWQSSTTRYVTSQRGFTLLEVLVALAILAMVMLALGQTMGGAVRSYSHLDDKTHAWMIASDKMVELQVYARWPSVGSQTDHLERNGIKWLVTTTVSKGPFQNTRRVDISVTTQEAADQGGSLYILSALIGKPHKNKVPNARRRGAPQPQQAGSTNNAWGQ